MNIRTKTILMAGALIAAASTLSAQAQDQGNTSPTVVYGQAVSQDQAITNAVVDKIKSDSRLSGEIGVETERGQVTLTGLVELPGQEDAAEIDARSVDGVRDVENLVHAQVGENF